MILNPLNLFTWKLKAALAIGLVAWSFWFIKHRQAVAFEQGVAAGKQSGWDDAQKQMRATMDAEWKKIREDADRLNEIDKQQGAQRAELQRARTSLSAELAQRLAEISASNNAQRSNVENLPTSDLVPAILHTLSDLDLLERERAGREPGPVAGR